ncbi:MAG TPA: cytochrome c nitrite reductase small subunit [Planctomycetota bacterium]
MTASSSFRFAAFTASATIGVLAGAGSYTFVKAEGLSYMSDDPAVCVNCHIMREQYDGWRHGPHRAVATCNDCHLPHDTLLNKLFVKGSNGWNHSREFTLQGFAEPIRIKPGNSQVLEANCRRCHATAVGDITAHGTLGVPSDPLQQADLYGCVRCHQSAGHGPTR